MPGLPPSAPLSLDDRLGDPAAFSYGRERLYASKLTKKDIAAVKDAAQGLYEKTLTQAKEDLLPLYTRAQEIELDAATLKTWQEKKIATDAELKKNFEILIKALDELEQDIPKAEEIKPEENKQAKNIL